MKRRWERMCFVSEGQSMLFLLRDCLMRTGHGKMITRRGVMEFGIGGDQSACGVYVPSEE
jgi:hypothetical protein